MVVVLIEGGVNRTLNIDQCAHTLFVFNLDD